MKNLNFNPKLLFVFSLFVISLASGTAYSQGNFCKLVFCNCCSEKQTYVILDSVDNVVGGPFSLNPYDCTVNLGGTAWPPGSTYHARNITCPDGQRIIDVYFTLCVCSYIEIDTIHLPCCPVSDGKLGKQLNDIKEFKLNQNFPNPFNPSTSIAFEMPESANVTLTIYDAAGKMITQLIAGTVFEAGFHEINWNTSNYDLASGVYFYKLKAGSFTDEKKMVLVK